MRRAPDDAALLRAYHDGHKEAECYDVPKIKNDGLNFTLRHYAGPVAYDVTGWIAKNNDALAHDVRTCVEATESPFLKHVLRLADAAFEDGVPGRVAGEKQKRRESYAGKEARGGRRMAAASTVSKKFRGQLDALVSVLSGTTPHYVKCIKPNPQKHPGAFAFTLVAAQLRCSGALEVVRIRRQGLPIRQPFDEFFRESARPSGSTPAVPQRGRG